MTIKESPLFSVITITKDNLAGLQKTTASLLHQSHVDYEWIIVDGASTDGTLDFIKDLPAKIISERDNGIYNAMNKGLALATGHYVIFMNAGDLFADADILSTLSTVIKCDAPDFIYGDALESSGHYKKARSHIRIKHGMFTHHQAMLYARAKIADLKFNESLKIASDFGFTAAFLAKTHKAHYVPCAICVFESGGVSERNRTLGRREQFALRQKMALCSNWDNLLIYLKQKLAADLRQIAPEFYYRLRQK